MIGNLHQSNLIVLVRFMFGVVGLAFAYIGQLQYAMISLMITAILSYMTYRISEQFQQSEAQITFALEIEVLADFVGFGLIPAGTLLSVADGQIWAILVVALFLLAVAIRLAHFNRSVEYQGLQAEREDSYQGLPLIAVAVVLPLISFIAYLIGRQLFQYLLAIVLLALSFGFVIARPIPRLTEQTAHYIMGAMIIAMIAYLLLGSFIMA
ncbi:hypothetical protein HZY91_06880 [Facklamia sp. DSM 111018]|uniref:Uncharacterized protein n=1 Tax=Facklamia lactis TaxID=2749967 RepID=A0ABS0LR21_9LACT|nr:hypothetical protein [Facklamia lactis]MBG9986617.1 hypothetical protein [Facklamia lactis]